MISHTQRRLFILASLLLLPNIALAGGGGPVHISHLFWYAVNFSIYVVFLFWIGKKPFLRFWSSRREEIESAVNKGERELAEAEALLKESKEKLAQLTPNYLEGLVKEIEQDGVAEGELLVQSATEQAERIQSQTALTVEAETQRSEKHIRQELAEQVIHQAREKLQSLSNSADDKVRRLAALENAKELVSH